MISILCPTRERPKSMIRLWESIKDTVDNIDDIQLIFYIDEDDELSEDVIYLCFSKEEHRSGRLDYVLGPRKCLSIMWNDCYKVANGPIYMHCGDDIVFESKGWDTIVKKEFDKYEDKILLVHGFDGKKGPTFGTHGFLHKNWVETIGYFVPPYFRFWYNDTWLNEVANSIGRRKYIPEIKTNHYHCKFSKEGKDSTYSYIEQFKNEATEIWGRTENERKKDAEKLRKFIKEYNG